MKTQLRIKKLVAGILFVVILMPIIANYPIVSAATETLFYCGFDDDNDTDAGDCPHADCRELWNNGNVSYSTFAPADSPFNDGGVLKYTLGSLGVRTFTFSGIGDSEIVFEGEVGWKEDFTTSGHSYGFVASVAGGISSQKHYRFLFARNGTTDYQAKIYKWESSSSNGFVASSPPTAVTLSKGTVHTFKVSFKKISGTAGEIYFSIDDNITVSYADSSLIQFSYLGTFSNGCQNILFDNVRVSKVTTDPPGDEEDFEFDQYEFEYGDAETNSFTKGGVMPADTEITLRGNLVKNTTATIVDDTGWFFAALYKGEDLISANYQQLDFTDGATDELGIKLDTPSDVTDCVVKGFLWKDPLSAKPLHKTFDLY